MLESNKERDTLPCRAISVIARFIEHRCLVGGEKMVDSYNRTLKAGDKLYELCQRVCARHRDQTEIVDKHLEHFLTKSSFLLMQVGGKQRFAKRMSLLYSGACMMHDESIDLIWRQYRKNINGWNEYRLACINCGRFENKEERKHSQCSACMNALYCSRECQKLHWKQHKVDCNAYSRRKKPIKR